MTGQTFPYTLGAGVGRRAAFGLIVLQPDETVEYEMRRMLPEEGVAVYVSRVPCAPSTTAESLARMERDLPAAAGLLPPLNFDAVGYACTSATAIIGEARTAELISSACTAAAVTNPLTALAAACKKLNISRLAFLSPYVEEVSAKLRGALAQSGINTPHFGSFNEMTEAKVARIDGQSLAQAAAELHRQGGTDAIFLSCTNLQTLDIIAEIENTCDCVVLSSNLVLIWHMLEQAGLTAKTPQLARLLRPL